MRFDEARVLLAEIPRRLPAAPRELTPTVLAAQDGRPAMRPALPDLARRAAAVLILIYPDAEGEASIVLTERSAGEHRHAGQISLPGGAIEKSDESAITAALREAQEEIGLDPQQAGVIVAGLLPEFDVRVSGFVVQPVVAFADRPPLVAADGYEVAAVLTAPLAAFVVGAPIEMVTDERDGFRLRYGAYRVGNHLVWGATAMILGRLGAWLAARRSQR